MNPVLAFAAGTEITCPRCRRTVARFSKDMYRGQFVGTNCVEWATGQARPNEAGEPICLGCLCPFVMHDPKRGVLIHLVNGWTRP